LLQVLESVFYGANISDILTHFTYPILNIITWLPYGVTHHTVRQSLWLMKKFSFRSGRAASAAAK
ncbi:hypothetical protein DFJ58DRAFT_655417, partial [Suillus subalutaceus]|uniref:uncharacterized protein n=1 Tax=Suillus subalutaceus TaxID=48586 RepID=UPI001B86805C